MKICKCCGSSIGEESRCAYCGMPVIIDLGGSDIIKNEAAKYRNDLVSRITDIAVEAFTYTVKNNELADTGRKRIPIANGTECFNRLVWAEENFVQDPAQGKRSLAIQYKVDGKPQSISVASDTPRTTDFWKIGVKLDDNLRLNVYTGREDQHTTAKNLDLSLR